MVTGVAAQEVIANDQKLRADIADFISDRGQHLLGKLGLQGEGELVPYRVQALQQAPLNFGGEPLAAMDLVRNDVL